MASQGIHSTHNAGYWFQEQFCSGSRCSPFDSWARANFALLNYGPQRGKAAVNDDS